MLTIEYSETGIAVSDFEVTNYVQRLIVVANRENPKVIVSTENVIHAVLLEITWASIRCNDVIFVYEGEVLKANEYGVLVNWPSGFADYSYRVSEDILHNAVALREEKNHALRKRSR